MDLQNTNIVLVGCGNMGFAMLRGWIAAEIAAPDRVHVVEPAAELASRAASLGVTTHDGSATLPDLGTAIVIFAVKPQSIGDVLPHYQRFAAGGDVVFASVLAGTRIARFEQAFSSQTPIIRVMPNTPSAVGEGVMATNGNGAVTDAQYQAVATLMAASGTVVEIEDEAQMDAVTAVSGSGPAYVFHMIEALRAAAIDAGLPPETANALALQTVAGAGAYAKQSGVDAGTLREQVTSPNGTTAAALAVLMEPGGLSDLMRRAVHAACDRAEELGS